MDELLRLLTLANDLERAADVLQVAEAYPHLSRAAALVRKARRHVRRAAAQWDEEVQHAQ